MKGKVLSLKIILFAIILIFASSCFVLNLPSKEQGKIFAASTKQSLMTDGKEEEYSALFTGDVIFSVEKVLMGYYSKETSNVKIFKGTNADFENGEKGENFGDPKTYYFKDIQNGTENKTVVDNGQFLVMNNVLSANGKLAVNEGDDEREAIIVSFGAYVYVSNEDASEVKIADEEKNVYSKMTYLDVKLERNGIQQIVPNNRNVNITNEGLYFDFVCVIEQTINNDNEGYYKFTLNYMVGNIEYEQEFEFYVVNLRSYTQEANPIGKTYGYEAEPTLGWIDNKEGFEKSTVQDGYVRYFIGQSGKSDLDNNISYPTITYDYTKYKLNYTHTANQKNVKYEFDVQYDKDLKDQIAQLNYNMTLSGQTSSGVIELNDYDENSSINLITIVLTEPGAYTFNYDLIYDGFNALEAPNIGIVPKEIKLSVHGLSAYYSKANFESAKFQYFELATTKDNHVDLFVPDGHDITKTINSDTTKDLGFVYKLVELTENDSVREGNILTQNSLNSLANDSLSFQKSLPGENDYKVLVDNIGNIQDATQYERLKENINSIASNISYVETNQGSIWISGNDSYTTNSFYYYSPTKLTAQSLFKEKLNEQNEVVKDEEGNILYETTAKSFTNKTSFNAKGYYFVFIEVIPNGISGAGSNFWQIFAFRYTSSSVDINVEAINDDGKLEIVSGGKYTNKNVIISWKKPGIFDREIKGYYYSATNNNASKEELLTTNKKVLNATEEKDYFSVELGDEVKSGSFVKYLIRLESEGESATHKIFTIDRQAISGVQPYLIEEMYSGNSVFYSYATDKDNYIIPINNSITNGYATINWDDKSSGAEIFASYNFTPFSQNGDESIKQTGTQGRTWITTNYQLGSTINGYSLTKADSIYNVSSDCILFNQGIYIIKIWDSAGNVCYYSFVIDRTENYFEVEGSILTNASVIYGDNVSYTIGDYKVFKLESENKELMDFVQKATNNNVAEFKNGLYYVGAYHNANMITNYFQKVGDEYYFTVKNNKVVAYNTEGKQDSTINSLSGELIYEVHGDTYYKRTLYAVAENQTYLNLIGFGHPNYDGLVKDGAFVTVEINKDNARGMVYFSGSAINSGNIPASGSETSTIHRLDTSSDTYEGEVKTSGMLKVKATSARNLSFVWNMGTGAFEVSKVYYKFYTLKPQEYNNEYYFYGSPEEFDIYNNGNMNGDILGDGRGLFNFNGEQESRAGLYVVTREYKEDVNVALGDVRVLNYYFIVDRNQIIDLSQGIGSNIELHLLENEIEYSNFSISGTESQIISTEDFQNGRYNVYLNTAKLPVVLNIPTGKYMDDTHTSADYYAGKLNVSVYFNDIYNQLDGEKYKGTIQKIFDSSAALEYKDNCYVIDIYKYLTDINNILLRDRLTESKENGTWLFLSGDYIIRLTDNVIGESGENHTKFIGFRVNGKDNVGPRVDSSTGYSEDAMSKIIVTTDSIFNYSATVSQEYLEVVLPKYDKTVTAYAQVDPNYVVATQFYGEGAAGVPYIDHPYEPKNGINLKENSDYVKINNDGSITLKLDTKLRVDGQIDLENINTPLYYTIKVRYKIGDETNSTKYENCYIYYDTEGNLVKFYEAIYTIRVDREAPKANIEYLNSVDAFVEEYNAMFGTESMFENGVHETTSNLYFTKQYAKYYQENKENKGYIYAYQVNSDTVFFANDVKKVYYAQISDLSSYNLNLPLINETAYQGQVDVANILDNKQQGVYGGLSLTPNNYYEIIEQDYSGNTTQYVIHYAPSTPSVSLPFNVTTTKGVNESVVIGLEQNNNVDVYNIDANSDSTIDNAKFIKIELQRGGESVSTLLTTATTNFKKLNEQLAQALNAVQYGNFNIVISARSVINAEGENTIVDIANVNLYDKNEVIALNIEDLIQTEQGDDTTIKYTIRLDGANRTNDKKDLIFFAREITVKSSEGEMVFTGSLTTNSNNIVSIIYTNELGERVDEISCKENTTYYLTMTDVLGKVAKYRFRTDGKYFYNLTFENPKEAGSYGEYYYESNKGANTVYYGYTTAKFEYDNNVFIAEYYKINENKDEEITNYQQETNGTYNLIFVPADYSNSGSIVNIRIDLYDSVIDPTTGKYNLEKSYYITIDTRLSNVALRDYNTGEQRKIIQAFNNINFDNENTRADQSGTGVMNLQWNMPEENNYFDYVYTLHELKKDETYVSIDVTGSTNHIISTGSDSKGVYKFEIAVYGKDGKFLGNKIFSFEVQEVSSQIYYVRRGDEAISSNSTFKVSELYEETQNVESKINEGLKIQIINSKEYSIPNINENVTFPLYVTKDNLSVVLTAVGVEIKSAVIVENTNYTFTMYRLYKIDAYDIYLGILKVSAKKVDDKTTLIGNLDIKGEAVKDITSFTVSGEPSDEINLKAEVGTKAGLLAKNLMLVEIYYNNNLVDTVEYDGNYLIRGNGQYKFVFKDLAGNVHTFDNGKTELEIYVLREVVVTINGEAPIANGFYNDAVNLAIYASTKYVTGSISVVATKNGEEYVPTGYNPYVFSEYGTYRVVISAKYNDGVGEEPIMLNKVVTFTIINVKEARKSIDLTSLNGSKITKVTNTYGEDKTEQFISMLNLNNGGMNITYENVMSYENGASAENKLNVTAGKITFTITYVVHDGIYPDRIVDFSFTLNNEIPVIECSLAKGDSTTKNFKIYFNPAILYAQIGEAYIYINDEMVAHIDENSQNAEMTVTTSFKGDGDGDYYIKLVSSSGVVWDSYKVTIKEPLNFWAVLVIIVVVAVVLTVVITIIVLRRKMRIR